MTSPPTIELSIAGMSCGHCVTAIQNALRSVPGLEDSRVTIGSAILVLEPGVDADAARTAAVKAIKEAGYA